MDHGTTSLLWDTSLVDLRLRLMATVPKYKNQGNPSEGNPSPFFPFGNIGAPYMETFSLPRFTIGFLVCLFLTPMVLNVQNVSQPSSPPPEQYQPQVDPKVDPLSSSPIISSSLSFSSPGERLDSSNQEAMKK